MIKYFGIYEYNDWEGDDHVMYFPYEATFENEIQLLILSSVIKAIQKLDSELNFTLIEERFSRNEIKIAQKVIGPLSANYFDAIECHQPINVTNLITTFVEIQYEMKAREESYPNCYHDASITKAYHEIYKGNIPGYFSI